MRKEQQAKTAAEKKSPDGICNDSKTAQPLGGAQISEDDTHHMLSAAEKKSTEARNRGNDLYRKGLFDAATKAYFEALSLTPNDSAPLSNLSAVRFELGNYSASVVYAEKALKLLRGEADSSPKKQKLLSRLARAQLLQLPDTTPLISELLSSDTVHDSVAMKHAMDTTL